MKITADDIKALKPKPQGPVQGSLQVQDANGKALSQVEIQQAIDLRRARLIETALKLIYQLDPRKLLAANFNQSSISINLPTNISHNEPSAGNQSPQHNSGVPASQ